MMGWLDIGNYGQTGISIIGFFVSCAMARPRSLRGQWHPGGRVVVNPLHAAILECVVGFEGEVLCRILVFVSSV